MNKKDKNQNKSYYYINFGCTKSQLKAAGMMPRRACISPELRTPRR